MGTRFNTVIPNADEELCERLFRMIQSEVKRIEAKLNYFDTGSIVAQINEQAFLSEVKLDDEMYELFSICLDYHNLTFGAFDITMRRIVEYYNQNPEAAESKLGSRMNSVILNRNSRSIRFSDKEAKIDFGGFGKGYALSRVKKLLDNSPIESAFVSFGESSILSKGNHPNGRGWKVGINDYWTDDTAYSFDLFNESISTSSNYFKDDTGQLIFKVNVINPITGDLKRVREIVSVKSVSPLVCEILSTAFMNLTDEQITSIKNELKNIEAVRINYSNDRKIITYLSKEPVFIDFESKNPCSSSVIATRSGVL